MWLRRVRTIKGYKLQRMSVTVSASCEIACGAIVKSVSARQTRKAEFRKFRTSTDDEFEKTRYSARPDYSAGPIPASYREPTFGGSKRKLDFPVHSYVPAIYLAKKATPYSIVRDSSARARSGDSRP